MNNVIGLQRPMHVSQINKVTDIYKQLVHDGYKVYWVNHNFTWEEWEGVRPSVVCYCFYWTVRPDRKTPGYTEYYINEKGHLSLL